MARHGRVGFWLRVAWAVIYPVDSVLFKLRWRGLEHIPATGGVLVVANHVSHADPLTFARYVWDAGRVPRFLAKDELFRIFFVGRVLRGAGQIPVHRGTSDAQASLRDAIAALAAGEAVCIYPEGTVTRDPDMWPMVSRTGIARLALSSDVPVIPVAQWGPQLAVDVYRKRYRPLPRKKAECLAGPPVDLSAYRGRPQTAELLREVTDVIMTRVRDGVAELRGETPPTTFWRRSNGTAATAAAPDEPPAPPADSLPVGGVAADGLLAEGLAAQAVAADGAPVGAPADGVPADSPRPDAQPVDGLPSAGLPVDGVSADGVPSAGLPVDGVPVDGAPTEGVPAGPEAEASGRETAS
ncbi:MAG TPA: lysophospholipid acyltransferase family protein [Mycobacteriales bacterium]|nr:lysophospholipid acyltransferase family protein [Mycobacteriales bacterium]